MPTPLYLLRRITRATGASCLLWLASFGLFDLAPAEITFEVISDFGDSNRSATGPVGNPVEGHDGYLYGLTSTGGRHNKGTLYRVGLDGQSFYILHHFGEEDGLANPSAPLILSRNGYMYGATASHATGDEQGAIFRFERSTGRLQVLHAFEGDGIIRPEAALLEASDGHLYGTTNGDGHSPGLVFRLHPEGNEFQIISTLTHEQAGKHPQSQFALVEGNNGMLLGSATKGGGYSGPPGTGRLFRVPMAGDSVEILQAFGKENIGNFFFEPQGLTLGSDGRVYGLLKSGLPETGEGTGAIFSLQQDGTDFRILHEFDSWFILRPSGTLVETADGRLHGIALNGGAFDEGGNGSAFSLNKDGSDFQIAPNDVIGPARFGVSLSSEGWFYAATLKEGVGDLRRLPRSTEEEPLWLANFKPARLLTVRPSYISTIRDGWVYGASSLMNQGADLFYKMRTDGSSFTPLKTFSLGEGPVPPPPFEGVLIPGPPGVFFGYIAERAGSGVTIFEEASGNYTYWHRFPLPGEVNGGPSECGELLYGRDGLIYGVSVSGGAHNQGTVFRLSAEGSQLSVLHDFAGGETDTQAPVTALCEGPADKLYGATRDGIYRLNRDGSHYEFFPIGATQGIFLNPRMIVGSDGALYGSGTQRGGNRNGLIFRLSPDGSVYNIVKEFEKSSGITSLIPYLIEAHDGWLYGAAAARLFRVRLNGEEWELIHELTPVEGLDVSHLTRGEDGAVYGVTSNAGSYDTETLFRIGEPRTDGPGSLDPSFAAALNPYPHSISLNPDGTLILGGGFTAIGPTARRGLVQVDASGQWVESFQPDVDFRDPDFYGITPREDGSLLVFGNITSIGGVPRHGMGLLQADGAMVEAFSPAFDNTVMTALLLPEGQILAGGAFTTVNGVSQSYLARLNADGTLDPSFALPVNGSVVTSTRQTDGKILIGGNFTHIDSVARAYLARLNADGSLDPTFAPELDSAVHCLAVQADGDILVGGAFQRAGQPPRAHLARFDQEGRVDDTFDVRLEGDTARVASLIVQTDRKIIVSGEGFTAVAGGARTNIARVTAKGVLDESFNPQLTGGMSPTAMRVLSTPQPNGQLLVHGEFSEVNGKPQPSIARLYQDAAIDELDVPSPQRVIWTRGGSAPEAHEVTFEFSPDNGASWLPLGPGHRWASGWELTGIQLPAQGLLRARARVFGGLFNNTSSLIENVTSFAFPQPELAVHQANTNGTRFQNGSLWDFGDYFSSWEESKALVIHNAGNAPLTVDSFSFEGQEAAIYATFPPTPLVLAPGETADIIIRLNIETPGWHEATLGWKSSDPSAESFSLKVGYHLLATRLALYEDTPDGTRFIFPEEEGSTLARLDLGTARRGESLAKEITVSNHGFLDSLVFSIPDSGLEPYTVSPFGTLTLDFDETAILRVERITLAEPGLSVVHWQIQTNELKPPIRTLEITSLVLGPFMKVAVGSPEEEHRQPVTHEDPNAVVFPSPRVGTSSELAFLIENSGNEPLTMRGWTLPQGFSLKESPAFPLHLEPNATKPFVIVLDGAAVGHYAGWVEIDNDDTDKSPFRFRIEGTVTAPDIAVYDGRNTAAPELSSGQTQVIDWGRVIQGKPDDQVSRPFTIANSGTAPLEVTSITVPPGYILWGNPETTLAPGTSLTWTVGLATHEVGSHAGSIIITSDDPDESRFIFPVAGEIYIPEPEARVVNTTTQLNRQTGLREQTVRITNDSSATVPAYRLLIRNLPAGVTLANTTETWPDGTAIVIVRQPLAPFSSFDLVLEFASATRQPAVIELQLNTEVILEPASDDTEDQAPAGTFAIDRVAWLGETDGLLLEFGSTPNRLYVIEYSEDGAKWKTSSPQVKGTGNRTQWIDRGPPRTVSPPSSQNPRFYRVRELVR